MSFIKLDISNCSKAQSSLKVSAGFLKPPCQCSGQVGDVWELVSILKYIHLEAGVSLQLAVPSQKGGSVAR